MYFRTVAATIFAFIGIFVVGCNQSMSSFDLEPTTNKLFKALEAQDVNTVLSFYSDTFYKGMSKEHWTHRLQQFWEKMGPIESFRLRNKQADTRLSGKFYIYQYETVHKGNNKARHILTFIHHVDGSDVKLIAHKITAKDFP